MFHRKQSTKNKSPRTVSSYLLVFTPISFIRIVQICYSLYSPFERREEMSNVFLILGDSKNWTDSLERPHVGFYCYTNPEFFLTIPKK